MVAPCNGTIPKVAGKGSLRTRARQLQRSHTKRCMLAALAYVKANKVGVNSVGISATDLGEFRAGLYEVRPIDVETWPAQVGYAEREQ